MANKKVVINVLVISVVVIYALIQMLFWIFDTYDKETLDSKLLPLLSKEAKIFSFKQGDGEIKEYRSSSLKSLKYYVFDYNFKVNSDFDKLSKVEQFDMVFELLKNIHFEYVDCGDKYRCSLDTITVNTEVNTYKMKKEPLNLDRDSQTLVINEENYQPPKLASEQKKISSSSNPVSKSSVSNEKKQQIYNYVMSQFNQITKNGEKYNPEVHDKIALERASKYFGMSISEIDSIFIEMASKR